MMFDHRLPLVLVALALTLPAQTWTEVGDAGELPTTANVTAGTGPLVRIDGTLSSNTDVDLYLIRVDDPATFACSTVGGAGFDTQLWMFEIDGRGIAFDDDVGGTPINHQSLLTGQFVDRPRHVLIGVSKYDVDAADAGGLELWNDTPYTVERAKDGPGSGPVTQWVGAGFVAGSLYSLSLSGATFTDPQTTNFPLAAWALVVPADFPGQATFTPLFQFQHTPTGEPVTVDRLATGQYAVRFPVSIPQDGNFQVSSVNGNHVSVLTAWYYDSNKLTCFVDVFDVAGNPVDGAFALRYLLRGRPGDRMAYLWADQPSSALGVPYTPNPFWSWNGSRPDPFIIRVATGTYDVRLPNLASSPVPVPALGSWSVSAFSPHVSIRASVVPQNNLPISLHVRATVVCVDANGVATDAFFTLAFHEAQSTVAPADGAEVFLWADQPTTASYSPQPAWTGDNGPVGPAPATINRLQTGVYDVILPSVRHSDGGLATVSVSSAAPATTYATIYFWGPQGNGARVVVHTFDAGGAPADSQFFLNYITAAPAFHAATNRIVGRPCADVALTGQTLPVLGTNWTLGLTGLPASPHADFMLIGLANPNVMPDPVGAPGCRLYTDASVMAAFLLAPTFSVPVPFGAQFLGVPVFAQGVVFTAGVNPLGVVLTNGVVGTLGT